MLAAFSLWSAAGSFKRALAEDAVIWNFVTAGHEKIWPADAPVAARPGITGIALHCVCPEVSFSSLVGA